MLLTHRGRRPGELHDRRRPRRLRRRHRLRPRTRARPASNPTDKGSDVRAGARATGVKTGIVDAAGNRHRIGAYVKLERGNLTQLYQALYLFQVVGIGIRFPSSAMDQFHAGRALGRRPRGDDRGRPLHPVRGPARRDRGRHVGRPSGDDRGVLQPVLRRGLGLRLDRGPAERGRPRGLRPDPAASRPRGALTRRPAGGGPSRAAP